MTTQTELKPCPCGKTPASINVVGEHDKPKYAYCYGDCCNVWEVEFRNDYAEFHSDESNSKAVDAWNAAPRAFLAKIDAAKGDVPEGFVMVPVVMTDEMFNAMSYAIADDEPTLSIYNKLLAASGRQDGAR